MRALPLLLALSSRAQAEGSWLPFAVGVFGVGSFLLVMIILGVSGTAAGIWLRRSDKSSRALKRIGLGLALAGACAAVGMSLCFLEFWHFLNPPFDLAPLPRLPPAQFMSRVASVYIHSRSIPRARAAPALSMIGKAAQWSSCYPCRRKSLALLDDRDHAQVGQLSTCADGHVKVEEQGGGCGTVKLSDPAAFAETLNPRPPLPPAESMGRVASVKVYAPDSTRENYKPLPQERAAALLAGIAGAAFWSSCDPDSCHEENRAELYDRVGSQVGDVVTCTDARAEVRWGDYCGMAKIAAPAARNALSWRPPWRPLR